ncbi:MAG: hypothetical protein O3B11_06575 [Bacteroidetes bacterium]|nr:hypothetical protein [Bacteroidota bacterium]
MSHWFVEHSRPRIAMTIMIMCFVHVVSSFHAQDAISCLVPARWAGGQSVISHYSTTQNRHQLSSLTFDLQHRKVDQGIANSAFETSKIQIYSVLPDRNGYGGSHVIFGTIEHDVEGEFLKRFRAVTGAFKRIALTHDTFVSGGIHLGYGMRTWRNLGVWDSQYLLNPITPELEESGENILLDQKHYLESGVEIGYQSSLFGISYRAVHAPVNQSLFRYQKDPYAFRHTVLALGQFDIETSRNTWKCVVWGEFERQSGAQLFSMGSLLQYGLGYDTRLSDAGSSTLIGIGAVYRNTGQIAPIFSCQFQRQWTCWIAPDVAVGPTNINTGWTAGVRSFIDWY